MAMGSQDSSKQNAVAIPRARQPSRWSRLGLEASQGPLDLGEDVS